MRSKTVVMHYAWICSFSFYWWLTIFCDAYACSCQLHLM